MTREELLEAFVEASDIEVPEDLVKAAEERISEELFHHKRYENMARGLLLMPDEIEELLAEVPDIARIEVKTQLVLDQIIEQQSFEVSFEELEAEAEALAERQEISVEAVREWLGEDLAALRSDILIRKAIDFAVSQIAAE
jgi:FKBP-type peptidyl-prolyl cis-trans isomerase (trigger factor)